MKILLDHCVPKRLRKSLPAHEVKTTREMRWERRKNGALLTEAANQFDLLLTVDKNIRHGQNLAALPLAVVVLMAETNRLSDLIPLIPSLEIALKRLKPGTLVEIAAPAP